MPEKSRDLHTVSESQNHLGLGGSRLVLLALPRSISAAHSLPLQLENKGKRVVVCDFGKSFQIESRQFNPFARDPWLFRALESSPQLRSPVSSAALLCSALHLWGLLFLDEMIKKMGLTDRYGAVSLARFIGSREESLEDVEFGALKAARDSGLLDQLRCACIARGAGSILSEPGTSIAALLGRVA
jgi:hypothetical protein